jgi:alanine racemase
MFATSRIELSAGALRHNLRFLRGVLGTATELAIVVKSNAYGHGLAAFLPLAEACGERRFAVFSAAEAWEAKQVCDPESTIQIMGDVGGEALAWAVQAGVSFHVHDLAHLRAAVEASRSAGRAARIHLELETGMNRLGLPRQELDEAAMLLRRERGHLRLEGTCTHLAGAESITNHVRVVEQMLRFVEGCERLVAGGVAPGLRHVSSSAGGFCYPQARLDLVRVGISAYGYWPSQEVRMRWVMDRDLNPRESRIDPLRRVLSWKSRVMSVKSVGAGEFVGYGTSFLTTHPRRIAIVPVGYGDGFARSLSNRGRVLIHGRRCPVIGTVNMNMVTVDATGVTGLQPGDEVVLIGRQQRRDISVASFSDLAEDLNYEVLLRLPVSIPRMVTA